MLLRLTFNLLHHILELAKVLLKIFIKDSPQVKRILYLLGKSFYIRVTSDIVKQFKDLAFFKIR